MKYILIFISSILIYTSNISAQTVEDAIRYSNLNVGGTARTVGVGGAFGALGADFGAISINPAGLGMYRTSEFVFTPSFFIANTDAELVGAGTESATKNNFNLNNIGVVFHNDGSGFDMKSSGVAIGFNRLANFNREVYYEGATLGSLTDRFVQEAYGFSSDNLGFESSLAFNAGAIYQLNPDDNNSWTTDYLDSGGNQMLFKNQRITQEGSINEMVLGWGANYNHKFMVGATIGVPFISFEETRTYIEEDTEDQIDVFNELLYQQTLETSGVGINFKVGMVYRISQMFRLGLAVHSPTGMALNDTYQDSLSYDLTTTDLNGTFEADSDGTFDYKLSTPWRAIVSGAVIIGKSGFISADVEYVDYAFANFNYTADNNLFEEEEEEINTDIKNALTSAINLRIGGEYAIKKFRLRAGFSTAGSYRDQADVESIQTISAGLGYRANYFYTDFAFQRASIRENYSPYRLVDPALGQSILNDINNSKIMLTIGFKF